jgi:hypothetical protein
VSSYDELTAIRADPGMRRQAQRLAGDLAEDLLQQTWYIVALASARKPIERLGGYFYRVMVNAAKRMREDVARHGIPVDDPVAAAGARGRELAAVSAEDAALGPLLADARRESLRRRRAELRLRIPASSRDPNRYRDVILATAGALLAADGPASRPEVNAALVAAYPEWFAAPDVATATRCQRRIRGREDVWRVLKAVLADGRPGQATLPGARQDSAAA